MVATTTSYLSAGDAAHPGRAGVLTPAEKGRVLACARCGLCTVLNAGWVSPHVSLIQPRELGVTSPILQMRKLSLGATQGLPVSTEFTLTMATPQLEFVTPVVWCPGLLKRECRSPPP